MLEDEIQYLGTRLPQPAFAGHGPKHPFPSSHNPVTGKNCVFKTTFFMHLSKLVLSGAILHVEANGDQPAHDMTFYRSQTSSVTIGRKSSSDHKSGTGDGGSTAGFTCQVVSGKHAKLAFSDSGFVSLRLTTLYLSPEI